MVVELSGKGRVPVPARRVSSVDIQFPGGEKSYSRWFQPPAIRPNPFGVPGTIIVYLFI
jgi:hypothetical protein